MMAEIIQLPRSDERLWSAFLEARDEAMATGSYEDAKKARELWWRFLQSMEGEKQ